MTTPVIPDGGKKSEQPSRCGSELRSSYNVALWDRHRQTSVAISVTQKDGIFFREMINIFETAKKLPGEGMKVVMNFG